MSGESEEPGESRSDRACRRDDARALDGVVRAAVERGVVFQDPYTAYLDPNVLIEAGAWVGAGTHILGNTRIERDARVAPINSQTIQSRESAMFNHLRASALRARPGAINKQTL